MILLNEGQRPLLEFLRNLTPQVLLATMALVLWAHIDFGRVDWSNWLNTGAFFASTGLFVLAFFANMSQLFDALLGALDRYGRLARRLRSSGVSQAGWVTLGVMFRQRRTLVLDMIATIAIVEIAWITIAFAAANAARAALR